MHVIIRLSQEAQAAELEKPSEEQVRFNRKNGDYRHYMTPETPEQQAIEDALAHVLPLRLGRFTPSTITRQPLVVPETFDAPPANEAVWQQLAVMAQQHNDMINPAGLAW